MYKLLLTLILGFPSLLFCQDYTDYFIVDSDTTFCKDLEYSVTMQGYIAHIEYVNMNGETILIAGRQNVPSISTLRIDSLIIDRIPQKTKKPNGYTRYSKRVVDGKLVVDYYRHVHSSSYELESEIVKFYIKMPDGTFYDINKSSDMEKYIIPYLKTCEAFTSQYKGDYRKNYDDFIATIELFNSVCP